MENLGGIKQRSFFFQKKKNPLGIGCKMCNRYFNVNIMTNKKGTEIMSFKGHWKIESFFLHAVEYTDKIRHMYNVKFKINFYHI